MIFRPGQGFCGTQESPARPEQTSCGDTCPVISKNTTPRRRRLPVIHSTHGTHIGADHRGPTSGRANGPSTPTDRSPGRANEAVITKAVPPGRATYAEKRKIMPNWDATLAAVHARGPRCDHCGKWTFKSFLLTVPPGYRFCDYRCQYAAMKEVKR